ncbi:MAG: 4Fe-4S ferredoxin [Microcoleus sp. PH2017_40_RAT_O_B]|uniref:circadian clock protein LdpA n=1 Tax=unclassified Microcoleus TaxID=2642155 RepID=UPI001DBFA722|nr:MULTISPECIES: LdpA C-terminal domain-containing domain [unclassified Microcoleus]TAF98860.1 MAG: 4Fe-4S ferredoxin [Oscillatoriales cyanobacterium]MCC3437832.1 4Fe-4S ferredoxin [Microcoleus sp. PH2017_05_CCC_O_A]MCC3571051.1 4Fe-4S ferredoxin [Microcoleus sp. PH2017_34_RAT_O_A]MCC3608696.1 4Fe-4S ferredoxin [Microcoleus sp. PH2017_40_RAT_O_B]TAG14705.1 MAG: 4Fe-4S ferredoxin [Oscillatoriales cyanobacterium]
MTEHYHPLNSLKDGHWFKLICGASFQHLPAVRNLTLAYTLAGADCIDVAADPAAVAAAKEALQVASELQAKTQNRRFGGKGLPLLMVSLNDGEDPHFRKAEFNPADCPADCWRPCEKICPASAIVFQSAGSGFSGVIDQQCYGCGRCLPVCPSQLIYTRSYVSAPAAIAPLILQSGADALEIHTQVGREADFARLWSSIDPWVDQLKVIAISCPDGDGLIDYLRTLYQIISPLPCPLIWQTDGRPMSGDIGIGTTRAAVKLGQKVLAAQLPGYVQLAGGTNDRTVSKLRASGLLLDGGKNLSVPPVQYIAGVAYGSYARVLLSPILEQLETMQTDRASAVPVAVPCGAAEVQTPRLTQLEAVPELLSEAVSLARSLVSQIKSQLTVDS